MCFMYDVSEVDLLNIASLAILIFNAVIFELMTIWSIYRSMLSQNISYYGLLENQYHRNIIGYLSKKENRVKKLIGKN